MLMFFINVVIYNKIMLSNIKKYLHTQTQHTLYKNWSFIMLGGVSKIFLR